MSFEDLALFIDVISTIFIWIVIASSLLSFVLSPYHPVRETLDRIVAPFLNPIRRIMPAAGMFDFSPLILIILVSLLSQLLITLIRSL
jgi:YggT family protein